MFAGLSPQQATREFNYRLYLVISLSVALEERTYLCYSGAPRLLCVDCACALVKFILLMLATM